eukprot:266395_1
MAEEHVPTDYSMHDKIEVIGLKQKCIYNGCKGEIIGPMDNNLRYPIKILTKDCIDQVLWIKSHNIQYAVNVYSIHDKIKVIGLKRKCIYNGCKGEIIGPMDNNLRYPIKILTKDCIDQVLWINSRNIRYAVNVYSDANRKHTYEMNEKKEFEPEPGKMRFAGAEIDIQKYLDVCFNNGKLYNDTFSHLSVEDQRDVLLDKKQIVISEDARLMELVQQHTGSNGEKCDSCYVIFETENDWDECAELDRICEFCKYTVCDNCCVHHSRGKCFCKDSNFGYDYDSNPNDRELYQYGGYLTKSQRIRANKLLRKSRKKYKYCGLCKVKNRKKNRLKMCSGCRNIYYCSRHCQKISWNKVHRLCCLTQRFQ